MKQITLLVLALSLVGIMAFGFVSDVSAEEISPLNPGNGRGNGRNGGGTGTGIPMEQNISLEGMLDEYMSAYIADGLGISVENLKAREAAGETLVAIGLSLGFDAQTIIDLRVEARIAALNQAVVDGLLTAEQTQWMLSRLDNSQAGINADNCTGDPSTCTQPQTKFSQKFMRGNRFATQQ
jgi:hypothetical protein